MIDATAGDTRELMSPPVLTGSRTRELDTAGVLQSATSTPNRQNLRLSNPQNAPAKENSSFILRGCKTVVVGVHARSNLMLAGPVDNYPGSKEGVIGQDLLQTMYQKVKALGAELLDDLAVSADLLAQPMVVKTMGGVTIITDALIIATGARFRRLGLAGEEELIGHGISACATCDGFAVRGDKRVVLVGGGDTAMEFALHLSRLVDNVIIVHRGDRIKAKKNMLDPVGLAMNEDRKWKTEATRMQATGDFTYCMASCLLSYRFPSSSSFLCRPLYAYI